jgi:hypothetical protein
MLGLTGCKCERQSLILASMAACARPVLAILLALALVVGGVGRFAVACGDDLPAAHVHDVGSHSGHHHSHDHDTGKKPLSAPACLKCCGVCVADPSLARAPAVIVDLRVGPAVFVIATQTYRDRPVVLDPGIPKPIA